MNKRIKAAQDQNSLSDDSWSSSFVWLIFLSSLTITDWVKENKVKSALSLIVSVAALIIGATISWKSAAEIISAYTLLWVVWAIYHRWQNSSSPFSGW